MLYSAEAFRRAAALHIEINAGEPGATVAALERALDPFGVRYIQMVHGHAERSIGRFSAVIDTAPTLLKFHMVAARHDRIGDVACELLRAGISFDTDSAQIGELANIYQLLVDEHRRIGGSNYFVTTPLWRQKSIAGFSTYFFERAPDERNEIMAILNVVSQSIYDQLADRKDTGAQSPLTPRQREALRYCSEGKSDWDIGVLMNVATATAHEHVEAAKRRLGVKTRIQAVLCAYKNGWI